MNATELIPLLGESTTNAHVQELLKHLNVKKQPKAKSDDPRADVEVKELGFDIVFEDENYLLDNDVQHYGQGDMIMTTFFFYPDGKSGYKKYKGNLYNDVTVDDDRKTLIQKLGKPQGSYISNDIVRNERWLFGDNRFVVAYKPDGSIKHMSIICLKYENKEA